jgi:UDP-glucose 4-epimerase
LLTGHLAGATGTDIVNARIAAVWGPLGRPDSPFLPAARLVHAVAAGAGPDTSGLRAGDSHDQIYAADCGRAIALLQLAERLPERTYNVGGGRLITNGEFVAALPGAPAAPAPGRDPAGPAADLWLDTTRLRRDTGYRPEYDTARGIADYLAWLRAGNPR